MIYHKPRDRKTWWNSLLQVGGESKEDPACLAQKMATPVTDMMQQWGLDCECADGGITSEELDEMNRKLIVKIRDTEAYLEAAIGILADLEQDYECLKAVLGDATVDMERSQSEMSQAGVHQQSSGKVSDGCKRELAHLQSELESWQRGSRDHIAGICSLWAHLVNLHDEAESLRRESGTLQGEHHGPSTQLPESGHSQHDTDEIELHREPEENVEMEWEKVILQLGGGSSTEIASPHLQEPSTTE